MNDQMSSLREKGIKALVVGPDSSETENKEASEGKYKLVFLTPKALFGSHRATIPTLKNKIEAVFIDEVHYIVKEGSILLIFTLLESYVYTTFRSAAFLLSKVRFCCLPRLFSLTFHTYVCVRIEVVQYCAKVK